MQKAVVANEKLDRVCEPLERNEQAENEASKTLEFLTQKEWLDAELDDSEKLTAHHCEVLIKRGLQKHMSHDCLTCAHHSKQLWSAKEVWYHFMKHKNSHQREREEIRAEIDDPSNDDDLRDDAVVSQGQGDHGGVGVQDVVEHRLKLAIAAYHGHGESTQNTPREDRIEREKI